MAGPKVYRGRAIYGVLYAANMAFERRAILALGAFDERFARAAEDNDLCYRWLQAGGTIAYDPGLVVWHHEWRTPAELAHMYVQYARGQGIFYAKHLRRGDISLLADVGLDLARGARRALRICPSSRRAHPDPLDGVLSGLPRGLLDGWRTHPG
jgi:GT2 family glycosyltransferase